MFKSFSQIGVPMIKRRSGFSQMVYVYTFTLWVTAFGIAQNASAEILTVANSGFEDISTGINFNEFSFGAPTGWSLHDPNSVAGSGAGPNYYIGTLTPNATPNPAEFFTLGAPQGQRVGIAFNFARAGGGGEYGFSQTLSATLQPNTTYTLNVDVGNIGSGTAVNGDFFNLSGFPGYRIDLLAGGVVIAQDLNSLSGTIPEAAFATSTVNFQTGAFHSQLNQALGIRLVNLNIVDSTNPTTLAADLEVDFDNVRLFAVTAVPEPGCLMLLSVPVLGFIRFRKRLAANC